MMTFCLVLLNEISFFFITWFELLKIHHDFHEKRLLALVADVLDHVSGQLSQFTETESSLSHFTV